MRAALALTLTALAASCSPPPLKPTPELPPELPRELPPPPRSAQLNVTEARSSLTLSELDPELFDVRVELALSWPVGGAASGYLNVSLPKALKGEVRVSAPCALSTQGDAAQLTCERVSGEERTRVQVSAQGVWDAVSGHHALHEGERTYRLVSLSPSAWSDVFVGGDARLPIARVLELSAPRGRVSLARLGRDEGEITLGGDDPSAPVTQTWTRSGALTEPLLLAFGDWEEPLKVSLSGGRVASLLTPVGASFYRVGDQSFKEKQAALLQAAERQVSALFSGPPPDDLWLISLPPQVDGDLPALQRWGVMQVDEAWFHRHALSPGAQRPRERARLLRELALSRAQLDLGPWAMGALEWVALRLVWAALDERERVLSQQLYAIQHTRSLDEPDSSRPLTPSRALDLIEMTYGWLSARAPRQAARAGEGGAGVASPEPLPLSALARAALESDEAVIANLQALTPDLREALSSLMRAPRPPHVEVSYAPRADDPLTLDLTVRSLVPLTPLGESAETPAALPAGLPAPPLCLRVGLEGGALGEQCLKVPPPDSEGRARLSLRLPSPARWLHPNAHQRGFYTWSLPSEHLRSLLSAEDLSEVEWGALPEVMFQLMSAGVASPTQYLDTLNALAMREFTPATLSLLFTHLNRAVHYLGALGLRDDAVRRWAASLLRGVMASEARFGAPPFSDITQLQLAEWESPDAKALSPDTRKRLSALLADQGAEGEVGGARAPSDAELETLQYPLMLWVRIGEPELWERVSRKFAQSDDQPLLRLLTLQALGAFGGAELLKTLALFEGGEPSEEAEEGRADGEPLEVLEALEPEREGGAAQEPEGEEEEEGEGELIPSLKEDEALSLARSIRTTEERRAAWRWLAERLRAGKGAELVGFDSVDVQRAFLRWGAALCDEEGVKSLERALSAESGFSPLAHPEARRSIRQARRCVALRPSAPQAEAWVNAL